MTWQDYMTVSGFAVGLLGLILAAISIWYAVIQTRLARQQTKETQEANFKVRTAEQAVAQLRDELHRRGAAQFHDSLATGADALVTAVRTELWDEAYKVAQKLGAGIQNSIGAYSGLLDSDDSSQFTECSTALKELLQTIPMPGEDAEQDVRRAMQQLSTIVNFATQRVAGKFRLLADQGRTNGN
jgi:hypothetical protein